MGEVEMAFKFTWKHSFTTFPEMMLGQIGMSSYTSTPSRSKSSPWSTSDMYRRWHPFDALLAERRAILAGERAALEAAEKKGAAWWREVGRG